MAYNLDGVDKLVVNADVMAKIFTGAITMWNDPAIAALNSGANLPRHQDHPDLPVGFLRHDRQLPDLPDRGRSCSRGPRAQARSSRAVQARAPRSPPASCRPCRPPPERSATSRRARPKAANLTVRSARQRLRPRGADRRLDGQGRRRREVQGRRHGPRSWTSRRCTPRRTAGAYPLMLATYEIVCSKGYDADTSAAVKSFLSVVRQPGPGERCPKAGFVPLPDSLQGAPAQVRRRNCIVAWRSWLQRGEDGFWNR